MLSLKAFTIIDGEALEGTVGEVDLIIGALAAGATKGVSDTVQQAIKDAYARLVGLVKRKLDGTGAEALVDDLPDDRGVESALRRRLVAAGADADSEILAAAEAVRQAVVRHPGQFSVRARKILGMQMGDHNNQHNDFRTNG